MTSILAQPGSRRTVPRVAIRSRSRPAAIKLGSAATGLRLTLYQAPVVGPSTAGASSTQERGMTSILFTLTLAVLVQSPAEDSKPKDQAGAGAERTFHGDQVSVSGVGIEDLDVTSLAESLGAFFNTLGDQYGLETPYMNVQIEIGNPRNHALVTPDGKMFLRYAKKNSLAPMTLGNFPLARAMTRSVVRWHLLRTISTPFGLTEGMAEGFAAYIAEDALMQTTGKYDLPADKLPPAAAKYRKLLGDLDAAVGRPTLSFALVAMANAHAAGYQLLGVFRDSLASAVGEDALKDIFPASLVNSPLGYAIASKGEPLASSPIYMVSSRRV